MATKQLLLLEYQGKTLTSLAWGKEGRTWGFPVSKLIKPRKWEAVCISSIYTPIYCNQGVKNMTLTKCDGLRTPKKTALPCYTVHIHGRAVKEVNSRKWTDRRRLQFKLRAAPTRCFPVSAEQGFLRRACLGRWWMALKIRVDMNWKLLNEYTFSRFRFFF